MRELLIETWRSIVAHRVRFGLTSLGIAWGALMLTYLSSSMLGFEHHFMTEFEELGPRIVFMGGGTILKSGVGARGARKVDLKAGDVTSIKALSTVEFASPEIGLRAMPVRRGGRSKLLKVTGLDAESQWIRNFQMESGRYLSPLDVHRGARVAVLGAEAATRLFGSIRSIDERILIDGLRFRVIGTMRSKGEQMINGSDRDDMKVVIPYTTAQRWLTRNNEVHEFIFSPTTKEESWIALRQVRQLVGLRKGYAPSIEAALWEFNVQKPLSLVRGIFLGIRSFMISAGCITLFVGAVGVMNIMLVVVGERTKEIGVRKAVGATSRRIFVQFLAEATVVSGASGLLGACVGAMLVQLTAALIPEGTGYQSPPVFDPTTTIALTISLVVVGMVSGIIPALLAARTPPAEALRSL